MQRLLHPSQPYPTVSEPPLQPLEHVVWQLLEHPPAQPFVHPWLQPIGSLSTAFAITGLLIKATAPMIGRAFLAASLKNCLLF